jgi:hypothetical protein
MGKSKFEVADYEGKKIKNTEDIGNGFTRLTFDDNSSVVVQFVPVAMTVIADGKQATKAEKKAKEVEEEEEEDDDDEATQEEMREALVESGLSKKKVKGMSDEEVEEAYEALPEDDDEEEEEDDDEEEDEDEDEVSDEDMRDALVESGMTKKAAKALKGEALKEAYDELEEEEEEEDEDDDDDDDDNEEGDDLTADDIKEMDFDDLEDTIDEEELEIDIEDYDSDDKKSVEKLRKAVAKALNIKY